MPVKPLKYKNLESLKVEIDRLSLDGQNPRTLLKKLDQMYAKGEELIREGDQEAAYILFMKYFSVITYIQRTVDYKQDSKYYKAMMGKKPSLAMDLCESVQKELSSRYVIASINENLSQETENNVKNLRLSQDIKSTGSSLVIGSPDMRVRKGNTSQVLTSAELFTMLKDGVNKVLIMDCRSQTDFETSHMKENSIINIPEEVIELGLSANTLEKRLPEDAKSLWKLRGSYDEIVVLDWNTTTDENGDIDSKSKVTLLKNILTVWDVGTQYKSGRILVLDGGYNDWLNSYPWFTTNPKPRRPVVEDILSLEYIASQVTYPDLDDLNETVKEDFLIPFFDRSQKPSLSNISLASSRVIEEEEDAPVEPYQSEERKSVPQFDRAKKAAALRTYEERKADMEELLKQKVIETSEAVELERSMIDSERELQETIRKQEDTAADDDQRRLLEEQEERLLMKVEELKEESFEKDKTIRELQNVIEIYEKRDAEELMKKEKDMERQIKEAEMNEEIKRQEEEKLRLAKEREEMEKQKNLQRYKEKLDAARRNKKNSEDNKIIPQVNRTNKPMVYQAVEKVRQFSGTRGNVGRGLTGLKNLGNTCYMNSILQCISNNSALAKYFCGDHYRQDVNRGNKTKGEVAEEVAAVIKELWSGHFRSIACKDLKSTVGSFKPEYGTYDQQDSHEFLTFLMDWLHNDLNKVRLNKEENLKAVSEADRAWINFKTKNESLISTLFYGLQRSTVRCLRCDEESATYEPFSNLSLIIPEGESHTLTQCLNLYLKSERITGWRCPRCKELRDADKKTDICRLPPILVIHLKRFHYIEVLTKKRSTPIDFPLSDLNMSQYVVGGKQRSVPYDLYGVSNHYGTMEGGHYTAYCRSALFKKWYKFDDHEVVEMSPTEVKTSAAYILFYSSINYQAPDTAS